MQRGGTGSRGRWSADRDLEGERDRERHFCVHVLPCVYRCVVSR